MYRHDALPRHKNLSLSPEEALALLELCLFSDTEDDPLKDAVLDKVARICREFMQADTREETATGGGYRFQAPHGRLTRHPERFREATAAAHA